jgi:hypothetical protein
MQLLCVQFYPEYTTPKHLSDHTPQRKFHNRRGAGGLSLNGIFRAVVSQQALQWGEGEYACPNLAPYYGNPRQGTPEAKGRAVIDRSPIREVN